MDHSELLDKTKKSLRALLISAPRGVPKRLLLTDYRMVMGKELPFRSLGFNSLDAFIKGIPDVMREDIGVSGEPTLFPVVTAATEQIARFVATQKKPKLKKSFAPPAIVASSKISGFSAKKSFFAPPRRGRSRSKPKINRYFHDTRIGSSVSASLPPKPYIPLSRGRIGSTPSFSSAEQSAPLLQRSFSGEPPSTVPGWKEEYGRAQKMSISEMWRVGSSELKQINLVQVTGYICTPYRVDKMLPGIKYLLYSDISTVEKKADGKGMHPAVMLYFRASMWNKESHPDLFAISAGTVITVWGKPFIQMSAKIKGKEEPAILAYHYEKGSKQASIAPTPYVRTTNRSLPTSPVPGIVTKSLQDMIYELLTKNSNGLYLAHMDRAFVREFGKPAPENLGTIAKGLPGVVLDEEVPDHPLIFFDLSRLPTSSAHAQRSGEPPIGIVSSTLKQNIISLLEDHPSGVPVTSLDKLYTEKFQKEPPSRLVDLAKSLPQVATNAGGLVLRVKTTSVSSPVSSEGSGQSSRPQTPSTGLQSSRSQTPSMSLVSSSLKRNIYKLLEGKQNGVYLKQLPKIYMIKLKAEPPQNVTEIVRSFDFIRFEEDIPGHPVMYLKDDPPKGSLSFLSEPTSSLGGGANSGGRGQRAITPPPLPLPPTVKFTSEDEVYDVTVTHISSVTSFYVQIYGKQHSERFLGMMNDLDQYMQQNSHRHTSEGVEVNQLYGYLWEDEGGERVWCRAVVRSIVDNKAHIMFPDYGNSELVKASDLRKLPPKFYILDFQAVQCCLHGLTDDDEVNKKFCELALNVSCTAQVMDSSGSRVSVELMDSDPSKHETINSILVKLLHPIPSLEPTLPEPGEPMIPAILVDIDMDKELTVLQIKGPGWNQLQRLMTIINDEYKKKKVGPESMVTELREGLVCCALFEEEGKWYRAKITRVIDPTHVAVQYVDYGNDEDKEVSSLRAPLDHELFSLPFQAVKCTLYGLPPEGGKWTEAAGNLLWERGADELNVSVVEKGSPTTLPRVRLVLCSKGEELDLNQWLLGQANLFTENLSDETPVLECRTDSLSVATSTTASSFDDFLPLLSVETLDIENLKVTSLRQNGEASKNESEQDSEMEFSSVSSDSQPHRPIFITCNTLSSTTPSSSPSIGSMGPSTPFGSPSPLVTPSHSTLVTPSHGTLVTPLQSTIPLDQLSCVELPLRELAQVVISWIESPDNFVVQRSENVDSLDVIMRELNESLEGTTSLDTSAITYGGVACAPSSIDNRWYRVIIVGGGADSAHVLVEFLDYGGQEEVERSTIKPLPLQFTKLPVQGIKCRLWGIKPSGDRWSRESIDYFSGFSENQYFVFGKTRTNSIYSVVVFDGNDHVNEELKKKRFATAE